MDAQKDFTTVEWFEVIVIFNSLLRNIDFLRTALDSEKLSEDEQYNLEEELNDYIALLHKLKARYAEISDKGELSPSLTKRLRELGAI